jgi:GTP-binding protein HflX
VYAADQLFATLDATLRKISLQDVGLAILADTVGFIRHLPHDLVAAFKATLQETKEADLQIHVIDAADERRKENIEQVYEVLKEIGADEVPQLLVYNKIDKLDDVPARIDRDEDGIIQAVWLSAKDDVGTELLSQALTERLSKMMMQCQLNIPPKHGRLRGQLYQMNFVTSEQFSEQGGWLVDIRMPSQDWRRLVKQSGKEIENFIVSHH